MSAAVQLVCFDLGGVLMRVCDGWGHACKVAGVPAGKKKFGEALRAELNELIARSDKGEIDLGRFAATAGPMLGADPEHVIAVSNVYLLGPYDGAAELVEELADLGVQTACLSNTCGSHWEFMQPGGRYALPLDRLTYRFASHLIGARKPDAAIYEHLEREAGVSGEEIVFFDDLPANVEAAWRRGWRAVRVDPTGDPVSQARERLIEMGVL